MDAKEGEAKHDEQHDEKPDEIHDEKQEEKHVEKPEPIPYEMVRQSIKRYSVETERINAILEEIFTRGRTFKDEKDESTHPSYTDFKVPYHMTCRLRYSKKKQEYEAQFQHELNEMLNHQPTAYDAARFNRHLCITTLWPPLHNRREIEYFQNNFFRLNHKKRKRLEFLMNTNIN